MSLATKMEWTIENVMEFIFRHGQRIEPFEYGRLLTITLERSKKKLLDTIYVPNRFVVTVPQRVFDDINAIREELIPMLAEQVESFAGENRFRLIGKVEIEFQKANYPAVEVVRVAGFIQSEEEKEEVQGESEKVSAQADNQSAKESGESTPTIPEGQDKNHWKDRLTQRTKFTPDAAYKPTYRIGIFTDKGGHQHQLMMGSRLLIGSGEECDLGV